jgi:sugar lactone lactonase YvrE
MKLDGAGLRILVVFALVVAGCGRAADETSSAAEGTTPVDAAPAPEATTFVPPPAGTTGTPADKVTDPALKELPNPNPRVITNWAPLPGGRVWGTSAGVEAGPDGHIWAYDRCGGGLSDGGCDTNLVDPIFNFDRTNGNVLASFGSGLFVTPHGFHVDRDGNVWATDFAANEARTKGHQVFKFSPKGDVLMRLGQAGQAGDGPGLLNQPTDVITAPNGDIFVADGHAGQGANPAPPGSTGRILKFAADGTFIKEWGTIGNGPGEFRTPHAMAFDSQGRLFVADRGNHRIQIFDQDGTYIDSYYQFSRVSDLAITADDRLFAIDSESRETNHPGWKTGIRIGRADRDLVTAFIPPHAAKDRPSGVAGEGVTVDRDGNVYAAEGPGSRPAVDGGLTKYAVK